MNECKTSALFHPSFMFVRDQLMTRLLRFLLLVSMCDDVAEGLVVDVAGRVDGRNSKGLIHLHVS